MNISKEDIQELHAREYSIYDSEEQQRNDREELIGRNYNIFDEYETGIMRMEYEEEFAKIAPRVSLVSLHHAYKTSLFFEADTNIPIINLSKKKPLKQQSQPLININDVVSASNDYVRRTIFGILEKLKERPEKDIRYFYIEKKKGSGRDCFAWGYFDSTTKCFVIKRGTSLTLDMVPSYANTTAGISRDIFVRKHCKKENDGYILKQDVIMKSPSAAASLVLGRLANGWTEWKDAHGCSLIISYPNKV